MEFEVKSCPFCGNNKPTLTQSEDRSVMWVRCSKRKCWSEGPQIDINDIDDDDGEMEMRFVYKLLASQAVLAWNKRTKSSISIQKLRKKTQPDDAGW